MSATSSDESVIGDPARADVELRLPCDRAYASVLRTTTAGLAARLDLTIDDIEDLRIAVGEASALVLPAADPGADLRARFYLGAGRMTVEVEAPAMDSPEPDRESFAWQVLDTLATNATVESEQGVFRVRFTIVSALAPAAGGTDPTGVER